MFRDKWINRPLPYEQVRPLLNQISSETRDQLADYRELHARRLASRGSSPVPEPARADDRPGRSDRRALFNRAGSAK